MRHQCARAKGLCMKTLAMSGFCLVACAQQVQVYETDGDQSKLLARQAPGPSFTSAPNAAQAVSGVTITVNDSNTYQTIDGFGASLTDSAGSVIQKLDKSARQSLMRILFSPRDGAGISLLRQPMGACDFSSRGNY